MRLIDIIHLITDFRIRVIQKRCEKVIETNYLVYYFGNAKIKSICVEDGLAGKMLTIRI